MPVLRPIAAWSPVAATHRWTHSPALIMRRRPIAFVMIVSMVAAVWSSVFSRMVSKERRLPLPLVRVATWLTCQKDTAVKEVQEQHGTCLSGACLDTGKPHVVTRPPCRSRHREARAGRSTSVQAYKHLFPKKTTPTLSHSELGMDGPILPRGICSALTQNKNPN